LERNVPGKRLIYVLVDHECRVGYCQAYDFVGTDHVELGFAVGFEEQGKGYGRRMVEMLVREMECRMPGRKIVLKVKADNVRAKALYGKCGFVLTGFEGDLEVHELRR
jgi:ribosomal protein S18 acetylase RimI-like enzyme